MDLCYVCMVNERNKDFSWLCSFDCLIKYATKPEGECLIQMRIFQYLGDYINKAQGTKCIYEKKFGEVPIRSKVYSTCGSRYCLNIDHMKMMKISEYAKKQRAYREDRIRKERKRVKIFKLTFCRSCHKEISMIDRLNPYCDYSCEIRHLICSEIDMLRYDLNRIVEMDAMKIFVKEKCEEIIKLVSE